MREQLMIVKIDICCFGYAFGVPRLPGHSGVNICGGGRRSDHRLIIKEEDIPMPRPSLHQ